MYLSLDKLQIIKYKRAPTKGPDRLQHIKQFSRIFKSFRHTYFRLG